MFKTSWIVLVIAAALLTSTGCELIATVNRTAVSAYCDETSGERTVCEGNTPCCLRSGVCAAATECASRATRSSAHVGAAVLLTAGHTPAPATQAFLAAHPNATLYAVGGPAARAYPRAIPVVGTDRYSTAVAVARRFFPGARAAGLASGVSFPDALAAGPVLGASGVPLLLTGSAPLAPAATNHLTASNPVTVHLFGGSAVLSSALMSAVWNTLG